MTWIWGSWRRSFHISDGDEPEIVLAARNAAGSPNVKLYLDAEMLVMQGAAAYCRGHPFVNALSDGPRALERFYDAVQPRNFQDFYGIPSSGGDSSPPWELPWVPSEIRGPPAAECGLGIEHGVSYYGPVSKDKIALEMRRLENLLQSVRTKGYRPRHGRGIRGHFMRFNGKYRFFVRGGKHRAAVLVSLGWRKIPVRFCPGWPRIVDHDEAVSWPLVRTGVVRMEDAQSAFRRYFDQVEPTTLDAPVGGTLAA
jgi:hypothetical protein